MPIDRDRGVDVEPTTSTLPASSRALLRSRGAARARPRGAAQSAAARAGTGTPWRRSAFARARAQRSREDVRERRARRGGPRRARGSVPLRPLVERAHRGAAPDLVVDLAPGVARDRPLGREAQVGPEDERHFVLRVAARRARSGADRASRRRPACSPTPRRTWSAGGRARSARARSRGSRRGRRTRDRGRRASCARTANMVPNLSTWTLTPISNMSAAGAMVTSAWLDWASICFTRLDVARLDARLVDRAGEDVARAHGEGRRGRARRRDPARGADSRRARVVKALGQLIAEREHGGDQSDRGAVVGVSARVGLGGDVFGERDRARRASPAPR